MRVLDHWAVLRSQKKPFGDSDRPDRAAPPAEVDAQKPETSPGDGVFPKVTSAEAIVTGKSGRPDFES